MNRCRYIVSLCLLLACAQSPVACAQSPVASLTLDSCLSLARNNSAAVRKADLQVRKAEQVRANALTNYFPQVKATALGYHSLYPLVDLGIDDVTNASARDLLTALYGNYGAALGLDNTLSLFQYGWHVGVTALQPVFVGGKIVAGNRLAKVGVEAARLQRDIALRDVLADVEESYWLVVGLTEKQRTLDSSLALTDSVYRTVSMAVESGLALNTDLMQVSLKQDELRRLQVQLTNGLHLARRALAQSIGLDSIGAVEMTLLDDTASQPVSDIQSPVADTQSPVASASPEAQLLALQVRAAELERQMVLADALPQVAVGANYGYGRLQSNVFGDLGSETGNGAVFVTLSVPLSQWWATGHKLREHDLRIEEARLEQEDLTQKLSLRTQQLYDQMLESEWLVLECRKALVKAREHYRLMEVNYRAGMATTTDLMTAQTMLMKAQNDMTDALISRQVTTRRYSDWVSQP